MVPESARCPTISWTGSPGATYSTRNTTTRTPNSVGIESSSRRAMKASIRLSAYRDVGPTLAVENCRHGKALDPWLNRVEIPVEKQKDHRGIVERDLIGLLVHRCSLGVVRLPAR